MSRIPITRDDTPETLAALGLSRTSIWRSLRRGWYTVDYHAPEFPQYDGAGGFAALRDPWSFACSQVLHIVNLWGLNGLVPRESVEDYAQEGLLRCWERRHTPEVSSWPAYFSTIVRRKVQDMLPHDLRGPFTSREDFEDYLRQLPTPESLPKEDPQAVWDLAYGDVPQVPEADLGEGDREAMTATAAMQGQEP